jgi:hypothetical protein
MAFVFVFFLNPDLAGCAELVLLFLLTTLWFLSCLHEVSMSFIVLVLSVWSSCYLAGLRDVDFSFVSYNPFSNFVDGSFPLQSSLFLPLSSSISSIMFS